MRKGEAKASRMRPGRSPFGDEGRAMLERDLGGKWLIGQHGDSLLRLCGVRRIAEWKAVQAEAVQAEPVHPTASPTG